MKSMFCHAPSLLKYTVNITSRCNRSDQLPIPSVLITARGGLPYKSGIPSMFHVFDVGNEMDFRLRGTSVHRQPGSQHQYSFYTHASLTPSPHRRISTCNLVTLTTSLSKLSLSSPGPTSVIAEFYSVLTGSVIAVLFASLGGSRKYCGNSGDRGKR